MSTKPLIKLRPISAMLGKRASMVSFVNIRYCPCGCGKPTPVKAVMFTHAGKSIIRARFVFAQYIGFMEGMN